MPLRNIDDLVEQVDNWLVAPDLKGQIPDFIRLAEIFVSRELGWRFTEIEATGTLLATTFTITPPADCLWVEWISFDTPQGPEDVTISSAREYTRIKRALLDGEYPKVARHLGTNIIVTPTPPKDLDYSIWYHRLIEPLDDTTASNWLITNGIDCLLWRACELGKLYREDLQGAMVYKAQFAEALGPLKKLEWRARTGGGNLRVTTDYSRDPSPKRAF